MRSSNNMSEESPRKMAGEKILQLDIGISYTVWLRSVLSLVPDPIIRDLRVANYRGYVTLDGNVKHIFLSEEGNRQEYIIVLNDQICEACIKNYAIMHRQVTNQFRVMNKNKAPSLPERESSQLVKSLQQLGEQI